VVVRSPITILRRNTENGDCIIPLRTLDVVYDDTLEVGFELSCRLASNHTRLGSIDSPEELAISAATGLYGRRSFILRTQMGVPTPPFKRGVVRVQEIYSPGEGINGDVTDSDRKSRP